MCRVDFPPGRGARGVAARYIGRTAFSDKFRPFFFAKREGLFGKVSSSDLFIILFFIESELDSFPMRIAMARPRSID